MYIVGLLNIPCQHNSSEADTQVKEERKFCDLHSHMLR